MYLEFRYRLTHPDASPIANGVIHSSMQKPTRTWADVQVDVMWTDCNLTFEPVDRRWPAYAWPGGYPMYYVTKDGSVLSPESANKNLEATLDPSDEAFFIEAQEINWEDDYLRCDHSNELISPAYDKVPS